MRKPKLTEAERQEKIDKVLTNFSVQLRKLDKTKQFLVGKVVEAKKLNLKNEEQKARNLLGNCLGQIHRTLGMQMQLELFIQERDLSNLSQSFLECLGSIADEVENNVSKSTAKKAKKRYMKTMYNLSEQKGRIDDILDDGDRAMQYDADSGKYEKFEDEIDSLVTEEEQRGYSDPLKTRY